MILNNNRKKRKRKTKISVKLYQKNKRGNFITLTHWGHNDLCAVELCAFSISESIISINNTSISSSPISSSSSKSCLHTETHTPTLPPISHYWLFLWFPQSFVFSSMFLIFTFPIHHLFIMKPVIRSMHSLFIHFSFSPSALDVSLFFAHAYVRFWLLIVARGMMQIKLIAVEEHWMNGWRQPPQRRRREKSWEIDVLRNLNLRLHSAHRRAIDSINEGRTEGSDRKPGVQSI